jgi:hypothetical protein
MTRLALAGCELPQIVGPSLISITGITKRCLVLQPAMWNAAAANLSGWMEPQEIAPKVRRPRARETV